LWDLGWVETRWEPGAAVAGFVARVWSALEGSGELLRAR
jgi:hypothetical protein